MHVWLKTLSRRICLIIVCLQNRCTVYRSCTQLIPTTLAPSTTSTDKPNPDNDAHLMIKLSPLFVIVILAVCMLLGYSLYKKNASTYNNIDDPQPIIRDGIELGQLDENYHLRQIDENYPLI